MAAPREWPDTAPSIKSQAVTLITKNGRDLAWAVNVGEKRELVKQSRGQLWAVWTGNWSSHLFDVPRQRAVMDLT